jgi:hypothetical protein
MRAEAATRLGDVGVAAEFDGGRGRGVDRIGVRQPDSDGFRADRAHPFTYAVDVGRVVGIADRRPAAYAQSR